jgi:tetratricopeptide (TPR) repeat protein
MGGTGVSSGAENQAAVAAYVAVRMLLERPLYWTPPTDDIPTAIEGEVGGPGDDLRIVFGTRRPPLEVQCKRSLAGKAAVASAIADIAERRSLVPKEHEFVLVVGSGSTTEVRDVFATDVRNFRQGRRQGMRAVTEWVLANVPDAEQVLSRLYVIPLDVDVNSGSGAQVALDSLSEALVESDRAAAAWAILIRQGLSLAQRGHWDRAGVERLLASEKLLLRPIGVDARWFERIDYARQLNAKWRPRTAGGLLDHLAAELDGRAVRADVRRQLHSVRGVSAFTLRDLLKARVEWGRALEFAVAPAEEGDPLQPPQLKVWLDARYHYGLALLYLGNHEAAESISREILGFDGRHTHAWGLLARAMAARGASPEAPPSDLADTPDYRDALADIATREGDWARAVRALAPALAAGHRHPYRLTTQALALSNLSVTLPNDVEKARVLEEAERAATEAIRTLENGEIDDQLAGAFFARARALEGLGRDADAVADYDRAATLAPANPNVVIRGVHIHRREGRVDAALALLTNASVESSVTLRLLRAELRVETSDKNGAVDDLAAALDELPGIAMPLTADSFHSIGELATELERVDLAERAVGALEAGGFSDKGPGVSVLRGRIAAIGGDWEKAESAYRRAAALADTEDRGTILCELGTRLAVAGRVESAIPIYEEGGAREPGHRFFQSYVVALMRSSWYGQVIALTHELEAAAAREGKTAADVPRVLLSAAVEIVSRQEDFSTAARWLDARIASEERSGAAPAELLLAAAHAHAKIGGRGRSAELITAVLTRGDVSAEDRMSAANVLLLLGDHRRAIDTAFTAVRARPSDKRMISNFIHVVMAPATQRRAQASDDTRAVHDDGRAGPALAADAAGEEATDGDGPESHIQPDEDNDRSEDIDDDPDVGSDGRRGTVSPNSFVRVQTEDGQRYEYFIYADPPVDSRLGEHLQSDPAVSDLVGKNVGDVVVRNAGTWNSQRLRISRVLPAVVVVFRRYLRTFAAQFPDEAAYRLFHVGKKPTTDSLKHVLAAAHLGAAQADELLSMYQRQPIPLGTLARRLNRPLINLTTHLAGDPARAVHTDGPPFFAYGAALDAATAATLVVLTRPALVFLEALGLWDAFANRYKLIVPKSMIDEWVEELDVLQHAVDHGQVSFGEAAGQPVVNSIPQGAAQGVLEASRSLFDRVRAAGTILHRPLSALSSEDDERREQLGAASFDAVALARANGASLYADDLGLRAIANHEYGVASFTTAAVLEMLHNAGTVTTETLERSTVQLIEWGHWIVPIRTGTLAVAFRGAGRSIRTSERVLARLADPRVSATGAAVVAVGALRLIATANVAATTLEDAAARLVEALIRERNTTDVMPTFMAALDDAFRFLPIQRETVTAAAAHVVKDKWVMRPKGK